MAFLFVWMMFYTGGFAHPFHVSVSQVDFNQEQRRLEVTNKMFLDDLEKALQKGWSDSTLDVMNPKDPQALNDKLGQYLLSHLHIEIRNKPAKLQFLGAEIKEDMMYSYLMVEGVKKVKALTIKNTALMALYHDQTNLVHVDACGDRRSFKLTKKEPQDTFLCP